MPRKVTHMIIACGGDSNTRFGNPFAVPPATTPCWPEYAPLLAPQHTWVNVALGGATVCEFLNWSWSATQLTDAKARGCTHFIAAYGTNDINVLHKTRDEIITGYCNLKTACDAANIRLIVATTPRCDLPGFQSQIDALNLRLSLIEKNVAGWTPMIDFDTGDAVDALLLPVDLIHVTDAAQHVRAQRVVTIINLL